MEGKVTIYVNKRICEKSDIDKTFNPNPEPESVSGEFEFSNSLRYKFKGGNKTAVVGNVYRSPLRSPDKFNTLLTKTLKACQE